VKILASPRSLADSTSRILSRRGGATENGMVPTLLPADSVHARILVVDDHELIRMGIRAALAGNPDWEICGEALDGTEAMEKALQLKPDLVVMDIIMPTMSGIEAARQIRKISPRTKILMLSVHDAPSIGTFVKLAGADAFLSKLRSSEHLHETVAQLLR
jgi:DNA-binding NarL/FixJ family response regulator